MGRWPYPPVLLGERGFTLIEQMVVVGILAILLGIAMPNFFSLMPANRLNGAARQVLSDLMWARMKAVQEGNEFKVSFLDDHQYRILDDNDNDGSVDSGEWNQTKDIQTNYPDVTFTTTADPVFRPRGNAAGATITLTNSSGSRVVSVATSGRVKIN